MEKQNPLDKKKRCPKGETRNKEGVCVPKIEKLKLEKVKNIKPEKVKTEKTKTAKKKVTSKKSEKKPQTKSKTVKKMTTTQVAKLLAERRNCIQSFRDKL